MAKNLFPVSTDGSKGGGKPFKTSEGGRAAPQNGEETAQRPPGVGIVDANKTGQPLTTPSQEVVEGYAHGHSPRIPWPPAGGPDDAKKPFKI